MTALDQERQSRRTLLAAGLGAVGALAVGRLVQPEAASAADGDAVLLGATNTSSAVTSIENADAGEDSLRCITTSGTGLHATSTTGTGIVASTTQGYGMQATASGVQATGVYAASTDGYGVDAVSQNFVALHAESPNGTAAWLDGQLQGADIHCRSTAASPDFTATSHVTGLVASIGDRTYMAQNTDEVGGYAYSNVSPNSTGLWGDSTQGVGVAGTGDWGVFGSGAIGVYAHAATSTSFGLYTTGKIHLAGRSGRKTITKGHQYVDVPVTAMTSSSAVVATLQTYKSGYYIAAAVSYTGKFRLYLNKAAVSTLYFSYLVTD